MSFGIALSSDHYFMEIANNKHELLGIYQTKINQIKLAYASSVIWLYPDFPNAFKEVHNKVIISDSSKIPELFPNIEKFIDDEVALSIAVEELYASAHRSALKELFSITKNYCHSTGQLSLLKMQPWFQFWRVLRNCWSHDMKFNFNKDEKLLLPIEWSGVTIDMGMNGKELKHGDCSYEKIRELIEVAKSFVQNEIN